MSYGVSVPAGPIQTFAERAEEALTSASIPDEQRPAAGQAIELLVGLIGCGIVGTGHVAGYVSGHANTGEGSSPASVSISASEQPTPASE